MISDKGFKIILIYTTGHGST